MPSKTGATSWSKAAIPTGTAGPAAQTGDQLGEPAHLGRVAQGARSARIHEHVEAGDLLRHGLDGGGDAHHREVAVPQPRPACDAVLADLQVAVGGPVPLVQLDHTPLADLTPEIAEVARLARGRTVAEQHPDVEPADLREPEEVENVRLVRPRQRVGVGDDQLLALPGQDREDAGRELVARLLFEQRRVLLAVEEVLVSLAGALALHDLALLPGAADLHGEAGEGRAGRQRDPEAALDRPVVGVLERQVQLGERKRWLQDAVRLQADQGKARPVRSGELDRGGRLCRDVGGTHDGENEQAKERGGSAHGGPPPGRSWRSPSWDPTLLRHTQRRKRARRLGGTSRSVLGKRDDHGAILPSQVFPGDALHVRGGHPENRFELSIDALRVLEVDGEARQRLRLAPGSGEACFQ